MSNALAKPAAPAPSAVMEELIEAAAYGDIDAAFAIAYFAGPTKGNATRSYLFVSPDVTYGSARDLGSRLKHKPVVREYLRSLAFASGLTRDLIEQQVAYLASSDISELADVHSLAGLADCAPGVRAAVKKIKTTHVTRGGKNPINTTTTEIEMHGKDGPLSLGADILGMRKNQSIRGVNVTFVLGAGLDIEELPPKDITP